MFETAGSIDLSNNEIDRLPTTIPVEISTLDVSFNFISDIHGIERLQQLQDINLGFNRLADISILEFCPRLVRVNLSGNRCDLYKTSSYAYPLTKILGAG